MTPFTTTRRVEFDTEGDPRGRGDRATRVRRAEAPPR